MGREIVITFVTRCILIACGIGTSVFTARLLGPAGRGDFFLAMTVGATITQFGSLGFHSSNTFYVARDPALLGGLLANSLWLSLFVGGLLALGTASLAQFEPRWLNTPVPLVWAGAALAIPTLFFNLGASLLLGSQRVAAFNILQAANSLFVPPALIAAYLFAATPLSFLLACFAANVTGALLLLWVLLRSVRPVWRFHWDLLRKGIRFAGKAYLICLLGFLLLRMNAFVLKRVCSAEEVGYYSIAAQIADYLWILPTSVGMILFPRLVKQSASSWNTTQWTLLCVAGCMLAACAACAGLVAWFVQVAYGPIYLESVQITYCILPGVFFYGLTTVVSQFLAARGIPRSVLGSWLTGALALVVMSCIFSQRWGGRGAAVALSAASLLVFLLLYGVAFMESGRLHTDATRSEPGLERAA